MKNKKRVITLIIIIALLALGVGYAAISSQTLTINGNVSATASTDDFSVKFNKDSHTITKSKCDASYTSDTVATMTVTDLHAKNDEATATFQVKNFSAELGAKVTVSVTGVTGDYADYFTVSCSPNTEQTITAGNTKDYTVTVKLNKTVSADIAAQSFTITFSASPVESAS